MSTKKGFSETTVGRKFYRAWVGCRQRCNNKNNPKYRIYGGRGIRCEWDTFDSFKESMLESYLNHIQKHGESKTTLDRIDTNGNYSIQNCRWATPRMQNNNRRNNKLITFKGKTMTQSQWAKEVGVSEGTLYARLEQYGMTIKDALTTPIYESVKVKSRAKAPLINQLTKEGVLIRQWNSQPEAAKHLGIQTTQIHSVLKHRRKTCAGFKWKYVHSPSPTTNPT